MPTQLEMYMRNQEKIVNDYNGKIISVKDGVVIGAYGSKTEALEKSLKIYAPGEFIVVKCSPGDEEYTRRFRSRIHFAPCGAM